MSFIENEFNKVVAKTIAWHAKKKGIGPERAQLKFGLKEMPDGKWAPSFMMTADFKDPEEITPKQAVVQDDRVDWRNYAGMMPPFIAKALANLCMSSEIAPDRISAVAMMEDGMVRLCLYDGQDYSKDITTEEIMEMQF